VYVPGPLNKAGNDCQGQTLKLIMNIRKLWTLKVLTHWALSLPNKAL
jgi:hypothetical protein